MNLREHVLWVIKNAPETEVAANPYCRIDRITDREGYAQGKQLWQEQVESHPDTVQILDHAAQFFVLGDKELAESYLKRAQQLDPANARWSERLGQLYSLRGGTADAASSFSEYEKAQTADTSGMTRYYRLASLSKSAYAAGEIDKASQYATELLQLVEQYPRDWNYGNAIHHGNNVLGLVALWREDIEGAKQYLLKAGQTPGSPQLNSFGPNMSLAKALIEKGERDTVLQFFDLCRKFWKMDRNSLSNWADEVKAGKTPNFGANLKY
jgi:tetratricopeptide (TPR) repeat protein